MAFPAGGCRQNAPVKIISRNERGFLSEGKKKEYEQDRGGSGDKEYVFFHKTLKA
jgi:hypothetical protein